MAVGTWKLSQCMTQNTSRVGLRAVFFFIEQILRRNKAYALQALGNKVIKGKPTGQAVLCFLFQGWRMIWRKSLQYVGCFYLFILHVWELTNKTKMLTKGTMLHERISSASPSLESKAPLLERAFHIPAIWKLDRISALENSIEFLG